MDVNVDTIKMYIDDTRDKIALLKVDITAYDYRIAHSKREITTLEWLIDQYETALKKLEVNGE